MVPHIWNDWNRWELFERLHADRQLRCLLTRLGLSQALPIAGANHPRLRRIDGMLAS